MVKVRGANVNMKKVEKSLRDEQKPFKEFKGGLHDLEKMIAGGKINKKNAKDIYDIVSGTFDSDKMSSAEKKRFFACRRAIRKFL